MHKSTRRQFLKSSGAVIATAIFPTWGCDGNEVRFKSMPTGPDMDMMDLGGDARGRGATAAADYF